MAGAEPAGQMRDEKLHAVVARSTFRSQNVQNTPLSDHSWKLRCRKSARRCGAKHISKDAFSVAGAVQEKCSSELLGSPGADFLRMVIHFGASDFQVC